METKGKTHNFENKPYLDFSKTKPETDPVRLAKMKHMRWRMVQQVEAKALMQLDKAIQSGDKESAAEARETLEEMDMTRGLGWIEEGDKAYKKLNDPSMTREDWIKKGQDSVMKARPKE